MAVPDPPETGGAGNCQEHQCGRRQEYDSRTQRQRHACGDEIHDMCTIVVPLNERQARHDTGITENIGLGARRWKRQPKNPGHCRYPDDINENEKPHIVLAGGNPFYRRFHGLIGIHGGNPV